MASIKQRGDSYTITVCDGYDYTGKKSPGPLHITLILN